MNKVNIKHGWELHRDGKRAGEQAYWEQWIRLNIALGYKAIANKCTVTKTWKLARRLKYPNMDDLKDSMLTNSWITKCGVSKRHKSIHNHTS